MQPVALQPTRRTRRCMPKVRSGCATCKIRHVKCDETRPSCQRCTRTGRQCPGYPEPKPSASSVQIYNLPFKVPGSRKHRELLHFYCSEAAQTLARFTDPTLWTRLILQRSQHQPVVRNALVTLSALYRDYLVSGPVRTPSHLQMMFNSHRQLRLHLLAADACPETALLCSLIFYLFECLSGNTAQALWHLDQGLSLLTWCRDTCSNLSDPDALFPHLRSIYAKLDIHATIYNDSRLPTLQLPAFPLDSATPGLVLPHTFATYHDANDALTVLQNQTMNHLVHHIELSSDSWTNMSPSLRNGVIHLDAMFARYIAATGPLLAKKDPDPRVQLLQIQATIFRAVLLENVAKALPHLSSDAQTLFTDAVDQVETLLGTCAGVGFTVSTNLVAGLYFICMKTRHATVLARALELLESKRMSRDGLWEVNDAVRVVRAMPFGGGKLEDAGRGIVDGKGGLEGAVMRLHIAH
ncbi:hypothetical protein BDV25DRAFT_139222 [Aspergillus avenaceus]|uniref:Zn(2)-C6 fungal-type domain-containing protein n=1 Tax=Aspergillus avenaceus TaxID=36643 RepID=A0A5N6TXL6_ASPAV|nr:hypothetical protein BDV25DRAFT_139222 [Aspergillus avenaceus]